MGEVKRGNRLNCLKLRGIIESNPSGLFPVSYTT